MLFIDAHPLLNDKFTGIPQLTWHLAQYWLKQSDHEVRFFVGLVELDKTVIDEVLRQRSGRYFRALYAGALGVSRAIRASESARSIALYPHSKPLKEKRFNREVQIVHDLTAILTPELHPLELVQSEGYDKDIYSDLDHIITVSESTRDDLVLYCGAKPEMITVAYPGVAWFASHAAIYGLLGTTRFCKYVLILGTFEPRKNIDLVFDYIVKYPEILDEFVFCFCGSPGWGGIYERCTTDPTIAKLVSSGRVRLMTFVDERAKFALMKEASFLIYPSFYEGFGSPVAEALSLGVPVATSFGGSLPEVAGDAGYYFDPTSVDSLATAVAKVRFDLSYRNAETRLAAYRQGSLFTWAAFNQKIHKVINQLG